MMTMIQRLLPLIVLPGLIVFGSRLTNAQAPTSNESQEQRSNFQWQDGDILFQGGSGSQSRAIEEATGSSWTHCGIVFTDENGPYVIEAVRPVKRTELDEWLKRGTGVYAVKRLAEEHRLDPAVIEKMRAVAHSYLGRDYDPFFQWDDDRIYCSELVWKVYEKGAGIEIGEVERFGDMDLSGPEAARILKERYGNSYPADEPVVSPGAIHRSALLRTVKEGSALVN